MLRRVFDANAELAGPSVEVERAGLKNRWRLARVEVAKADEVVGQGEEVAVQAHQLLNRGNRVGHRLLGVVLHQQSGDVGLPRSGGESFDSGLIERLDRGPRLGREPGLVRSKGRSHPRPLRFGHRVFDTQRARHRLGERSHGLGPRRVEACLKPQRLASGDLREGEPGHLGRMKGDVLGR